MVATLLDVLGAASSIDVTEIGLILAAAAAGATVVKLLPERRNLTVDSAQKAVAAMRLTMDGLENQLERAQRTAHDLRDKLSAQISEIHQLEDALHEERTKALRLQQQLEELSRQYGAGPAA